MHSSVISALRIGISATRTLQQLLDRLLRKATTAAYAVVITPLVQQVVAVSPETRNVELGMGFTLFNDYFGPSVIVHEPDLEPCFSSPMNMDSPQFSLDGDSFTWESPFVDEYETIPFPPLACPCTIAAFRTKEAATSWLAQHRHDHRGRDPIYPVRERW